MSETLVKSQSKESFEAKAKASQEARKANKLNTRKINNNTIYCTCLTNVIIIITQEY